MIEYFQKLKSNILDKQDSYSKGCWINVVNPTEEEIGVLVGKFKIARENLEDGLDIHESPRLEVEDDKKYIYLTAPTERFEQEYDSSFLVVIHNDYFMTISKSKLEILNKLLVNKKTTKYFSNNRNLLQILYMISRSFEQSVSRIIRETKKNKKDLSNFSPKDLGKLIENEDRINHYLSSFGSIIQTYNRILRDRSIRFSVKDKEVVEDLIIDLNETLVLCRQTLKSTSNMRDYYNAKLSNDLNKTVMALTVFTIFLSIPTMIASIYGMNVNLPMQSSSNILFILSGLTVGIWALMFFILKKIRVI